MNQHYEPPESRQVRRAQEREAAKEEWPPNYNEVFRNRQLRLRKIRQSPYMLRCAKAFYKTRPHEFIEDWVDTFDPRNSGKEGMLTHMPFIMFKRQHKMVSFLLAMLEGEEDGLIEKCRDAGATWICVAFSIWLWLFWDGVSVGWGSRKQELVDKLGVPDSIFEKMRQVIRTLPKEFLPRGFNPKEHLTFMRIINPETGSTIVGEAGDNIGRGGRTRIFFKDESAHYERPELIEASLGDNTRCQIDMSSVNGIGNVFHRKRQAGIEWNGGGAHEGVTNVFVFDWSDHPAKTKEWYDKRRLKFEREGMLHIFAQEVERDYASSVEGILIHPDWVNAAVDFHLWADIEPTGRHLAGFDVADEGMDKNALVEKKGILLFKASAWGKGDVGKSTRNVIQKLPTTGKVELFYDCIGVGSGVKSETNRLKEEKILPANISVHKWDASAKVLDPDKNIIRGDKESPLNKDHYENFKAQAWSRTATKFYKTWQWVTQGIPCDPQDTISIDSTMDNFHQLKTELSQATAKLSTKTMKIVVDKSPDGTPSPNIADAAIMADNPAKTLYSLDNVG